MASSSDRPDSTSSAEPTPAVAQPARDPSREDDHSSSSSSSESDEGSSSQAHPAGERLSRPKLGSRKSSGTLIVPRDSPNVEIHDEEYDEGDARTMSPRRTSEEIEKLGQETREALMEQALTLQESLRNICHRVESVRNEHEKLEGENKFLQNYIGELMQTTKITSAGAPKNKGKARGTVR